MSDRVASAGRPLEVATYNIHRCVGREGRRDPERIGRVIAEMDVPVVGLQEVESLRSGPAGAHQANYLAALTGREVIVGPTLYRTDGHYGNALLSALPVRAVRRHGLDVHGREPRGAIEAELESDGGPVRVVVTHLGLRRRERRCQVVRLLAALEPFGPGPLVVMGDWNEWLGWSGPVRWMNRRFHPVASPRSFPSRRPMLRLDRIWVQPRSAVVRVHRHDTAAAREASDHLPVVARIRHLPERPTGRLRRRGPRPGGPGRGC